MLVWCHVAIKAAGAAVATKAANDATFCQKIKVAVHSTQTDAGQTLPDTGINFLGSGMLP